MDEVKKSFDLELLFKLLRLASYSFPVIYLLGFIIVNSYIFQFGSISLNIFDSRIVSAGISFAFLISPFVCLLFYFDKKNIPSDALNIALVSLEFNLIVMMESNIMFGNAFNSIVSAILALPFLYIMSSFLVLFVIVAVLALHSKQLDVNKLNKYYIIFAIINIILFWCLLGSTPKKYYFFAGIIFVFASLILSYEYNGEKSIKHFMRADINQRIRSLYVAIMLIIIAASLFGKWFYPLVPPYYGGGKLRDVEVVIRDAGQFEKLFNAKRSSLSAIQEYGEDNGYISFVCEKHDGNSYLVKINKEYVASRISK